VEQITSRSFAIGCGNQWYAFLGQVTAGASWDGSISLPSWQILFGRLRFGKFYKTRGVAMIPKQRSKSSSIEAGATVKLNTCNATNMNSSRPLRRLRVRRKPLADIDSRGESLLFGRIALEKFDNLLEGFGELRDIILGSLQVCIGSNSTQLNNPARIERPPSAA